MKNLIPQNIDGALTLCSSAINGATNFGASLKHMTAAVLIALRTSLLTAFNNLETGRQVLRDKRAALANVMEQARAYATLAKDVLKPMFGSQYSERWDPTGFRGSLVVADNSEDMLRLLESLKDYFAANAAHEVAGRNITSAQAQVLLDALVTAHDDVLNQKTLVDQLSTARDEKFEALRKGLRDLCNELAVLLDPLDARWLSFGFNKPGADETPDEVESVVATLIGPTAVALKWAASARAAFYHVWKRVQGVDEDYVLIGSPADLDFTLENLPTNATVDIAVSAVNTGGEGPRSTSVTITTHV